MSVQAIWDLGKLGFLKKKNVGIMVKLSGEQAKMKMEENLKDLT